MQTLQRMLVALALLFTSLWVLLFIWTHQPIATLFTYILILIWLILAIVVYVSYHQHKPARYTLAVMYILGFCIALFCFFAMAPKNDRNWRPENARLLDFRFVDGQVEVQNIRNFVWNSDDQYDVQWETRRYRIEDIETVDMIVSHFIAGPVAHVFVSFGFKDGRYLSLSLEVRQEEGEGFSTIGGFFRQYELALVGGDENDLIFSRTNIREEDLYIYPLQMEKIQMQMLFLEYLSKANRLKHQPRWYNTFISNCTTILFDLAEHATGSIPRDYRILLPGLIPNYLYDHGQLSNAITLEEWRKLAYVNPKTQHLTTGRDTEKIDFSALIRQNLPDAQLQPKKSEK